MKYKLKYLKTLILLIILFFPFIGTDCINTTTHITGDNILGFWTLVSSTGGTLHDICPGETINFQSSGVADLTCPGEQTLSRNYRLTGSVLEFIDTGVEYDVNLKNNGNTMEMMGIGSVSGRILEYNRNTAGSAGTYHYPDNVKNKNSSEK